MPGKVLAPILGEPMIVRQLERIARAETIDRVVVATSRDPSDDPLAAILQRRGIAVFRGSADDAVDRCAKAWAASDPSAEVTHVARFFCDNPLIDPDAIDAAVNLARASGAAFVHAGEHGGVEVVAVSALSTAAEAPRDTRNRRDLDLFFPRCAERYLCASTGGERAMGWTIDTPADFAFVRAAYAELYPANPGFRTQDVLNLLSRPAALAQAA